MRYELLIFDWDGTLADSLAGIVGAMQSAIAALELPPRGDAQIAELIGLGFDEGLRRLYPQLDPTAVRRRIEGYRRAQPGFGQRAPLFGGALETLSQLATRGHRLAVATGKSRSALEHALGSQPQLATLLSASRCADETADKPDPLMLTELLGELQVPVERALMVGDTEYDIAMARAIGMTALGVTVGAHDVGRLRRAGAEAVLSNVVAVADWLASDATEAGSRHA